MKKAIQEVRTPGCTVSRRVKLLNSQKENFAIINELVGDGKSYRLREQTNHARLEAARDTSNSFIARAESVAFLDADVKYTFIKNEAPSEVCAVIAIIEEDVEAAKIAVEKVSKKLFLSVALFSPYSEVRSIAEARLNSRNEVALALEYEDNSENQKALKKKNGIVCSARFRI